MTISGKARVLAKRLLSQYGQAIEITNIVPGSYDVNTSEVSMTTVNLSGVGVLINWDPNSFTTGGTQEGLGSLISSTDKRLIIFMETGTLSLNDTLTANGVLYTVKEPFKEINPSNELIMYDCNLRA